MTCKLFVCGFLIVYGVVSVAASPVDPDEILHSVESKGSKSVVQELFSKHGDWDQAMHQISLGKEKWLEAASRMYAGSDAAQAEEIVASMALALPKNPKGVLKRTNPPFSIEQVCQPPFIEPDAKTLDRYKNEAGKALAKLKGSELDLKATACLKLLK